jgi:hypothetical protein
MPPVPFARQEATHWHVHVPGARWFRADLHVHTLDDHPNGALKRPPSLDGPADDPGVQQAYARFLLRTAIARRVEVIGLTPHAVRCGEGPDTSAAWAIIDLWNAGADDDGTPFRDKIYAVFPGFEPAISDGSRGVHLLFLFDPEVGRDRYLRTFDAIMGGVSPWVDGGHRNSRLDAAQVFATLDRIKRDEGAGWDFIPLAPHAFSNRGLFGELKSQILRDFPTDRLRGLELGDNDLRADHEEEWLRKGMAEHRLAFYHASDACRLNPDPASTALRELGARVTLLKLASPRVEALRQAFLAADSRLRIAYQRDDATGSLRLRSDLPEPEPANRPWLSWVTVAGGTSFFGGHDVAAHKDIVRVFPLNPDFNCVIGGKMSGKSTLLDGLRIRSGADLPANDPPRKNVDERARLRFLSGGAKVDLEIRGPVAPASAVRERWPAVFYTQRELRQAARDQEVLRRLLFGLTGSKQSELADQVVELRRLDRDLESRISGIASLRIELDAAEQRADTADAAKAALQRFEEVGVDELAAVQIDVGALSAFCGSYTQALSSVRQAANAVGALQVPTLATPTARAAIAPLQPERLVETAQTAKISLAATLESLDAGGLALDGMVKAVGETSATARRRVEHALVERGGSAEQLNQFAALTEQASDWEVAHVHLRERREAHTNAVKEFGDQETTRSELVTTHRADVLVSCPSGS